MASQDKAVRSHDPQETESIADELVQSYEQSFRQAVDEGGTIYEPMSPIIQAAHERRMELLDQLPIGDVSKKICVDYGVGSWGFACIYPRLQNCAQAIGIDISEIAIKESEALSKHKNFPYGKNYRYFTSRGDKIKLDTNSVDIFFAGESIEHVENTHAFLDQIHRILKPQGILILTTPNADAYLFKCQNERYAVGPEHVALMGYHELCTYLSPRFNILEANGFNGSLHPSFDDLIIDADFARVWAAQFRDQPHLGTGLVIMAQRNDQYLSHDYQQHIYHHANQDIRYYGSWSKVGLHKAMTGRSSANIDDRIMLSFIGQGLILNFWTHDWSGIAEIIIDGKAQYLNLYSPRGGFERLVLDNLELAAHEVEIRVVGEKDPRSYSHEVIFYQAISYIYE